MGTAMVLQPVVGQATPGSCFGWFDEDDGSCSKCICSNRCRMKTAGTSLIDKGNMSVLDVIAEKMGGELSPDGISKCLELRVAGTVRATVKIMADGRLCLTTSKGMRLLKKNDIAAADRAVAALS